MSEGGGLKASGPGPEQIHVGMNVLSVDGQPIGRVKEVRADDFLVDRPVARDVYVPYQFILALPDRTEELRGGAIVRLNISAAHVDEQHWQHP